MESLVSLSKEERARALAIASKLSGKERGELLADLQKADGEIMQAAEEAEDALHQFEQALGEAEHEMQSIEREEEEQQSHTEDVRAAEQKLSDPGIP